MEVRNVGGVTEVNEICRSDSNSGIEGAILMAGTVEDAPWRIRSTTQSMLLLTEVTLMGEAEAVDLVDGEVFRNVADAFLNQFFMTCNLVKARVHEIRIKITSDRRPVKVLGVLAMEGREETLILNKHTKNADPMELRNVALLINAYRLGQILLFGKQCVITHCGHLISLKPRKMSLIDS
ncbi:unnamed protein product [Cyprideis torosa]|uniref:Uncharacterized protein n=1 Tax=Cyprideis torosa TaxID=163714 RepID=A0A7R8W6C8_9CRUS|nr:unnamed protein product [Cyprideis torosa]CAG0881620.1 unnamed protein product [Cyprideis torosa]